MTQQTMDITKKLERAPNLTYESDIGSGEKTPGELETQKHIRQIPEIGKNRDKSQKAN